MQSGTPNTPAPPQLPHWLSGSSLLEKGFWKLLFALLQGQRPGGKIRASSISLPCCQFGFAGFSIICRTWPCMYILISLVPAAPVFLHPDHVKCLVRFVFQQWHGIKYCQVFGVLWINTLISRVLYCPSPSSKGNKVLTHYRYTTKWRSRPDSHK